MDWIKNNIFNIAITLITVVLGIGAIYASLQLRKLTSIETKPTRSAEVQEVCRTIFSLKFKPTPTPTPLFSNFLEESTDSAVMQEDISITPFDLIPANATNTPTLNPPPKS